MRSCLLWCGAALPDAVCKALELVPGDAHPMVR